MLRVKFLVILQNPPLTPPRRGNVIEVGAKASSWEEI
jgi:hypothetical protein